MLLMLPALGLCWWRIVTTTSTDAVCSSHILQGKMLLLKVGELCWFQGRVNFLHRKYSPIQATVKKITSTLAKTSTGAHKRCPQAVSQGSLFCSSITVPALDFWAQNVLPVPLLWQLGTKKREFRPRGSSKRDVFGIAVPRASSSLVCLIFALLSPHQSSLELQQPVWHEKAAAAPGLRDTSQLLGEPGIPSLPVALPQGSHSPAVLSGSCCWPTPGKAPGMSQVCHC